MPLHKNVRRCSFVRIHKPGDLLKESKLLPMKARLHTQRNDILLHTEYESKIFVLPYIRKRVPVAEDVGEVCFQEKGSRFFLHTRFVFAQGSEFGECTSSSCQATKDQDIRRKSWIMKRNSKHFLALFMAVAMSVTPVSYAYAEDSAVAGVENTESGQQTVEVTDGKIGVADAALADGVYTPDKFSWSGGTGKVSISCTKITVTGGQAYATIVFSSGSYGYVKANGNTYYPTTTGSTSTFVIPVELNKNNTIIGMTTKMSTAHEISYSIFIYLSAAAKADGTTVSGETNLSADTLDEKAPEIMGLSYQSETKVEHAKYFKIYHYDQGITLLEIDQRKDEDTKETKTKDTKEDTDSGLTPAQEEKLALYKAKIVRYLIVPEDAEIPAGLDKEMIVIQKPKKSAYVGSEEVLEILDKLNATDQITSVGVKQKNCKVEGIAKAMKAKKIIYAGTYKKPENKKLMKSKCDLAILSNKILPDEKNEKKMSVEDQQKRYEELAEKFVLLDVPMIVDRSADEEKDDAKAEWSKVYEAIFAQTDSTDSSAKN